MNEVSKALQSRLMSGITSGLHRSGQLYVSKNGCEYCDFSVGDVDSNSLMQWFSATKPFAAVAIGQLWERGLLELDQHVSEILPDFAVNGKNAITIRHLLTHTSGFRSIIDLESDIEAWDQTIRRVCDSRIENKWIPGEKAGYQIRSSWFILAEIIRCLDGRSFDIYVREEIFVPLSMDDCWISMNRELSAEYGDRLAGVYDTSGIKPERQNFRDDPTFIECCDPGASGRGPARQLACFYEALMGGGQRCGHRIILPQTAETLISRHRTGMYDHTFQHVMDWGLGFVVNSAIYGAETVPYGFGRHAGPRTFGHCGRQTSAAFADPDAGLVVALVVDGMPGNDKHHNRFNELLSFIYESIL